MSSGYQPTHTPDYGHNYHANSSTPSFAVNLNRNKTRRWVNAKACSYDGDDWGDSSSSEDDSDQVTPLNGQKPAYPPLPPHTRPYPTSSRASFIRSAETLGQREEQGPKQSPIKPFPGTRPTSTIADAANALSRPASQAIPAIDTSNQSPSPVPRLTESPKRIGFPTRPQDELHLTAKPASPSNKRHSMSAVASPLAKPASSGTPYSTIGSRPPPRQTVLNQAQSPSSSSMTSLDNSERTKNLESRPSLGITSMVHQAFDAAPTSSAPSVAQTAGSNTSVSPILPVSSSTELHPSPILRPPNTEENPGGTPIEIKAGHRRSMLPPSPVAGPQKKPEIARTPRHMSSTPVDIVNSADRSSPTSEGSPRPTRSPHKEQHQHQHPGQVPSAKAFPPPVALESMPSPPKLNSESGSSTPDDSAARTHEHLESEIMMSLEVGKPAPQPDPPVHDVRSRATSTPSGLPPAQRSRHSFHPASSVQPQTAPLDVASKHKSFSLCDTFSEKALALKEALPRPPNRRKFSWEEDSEDESAAQPPPAANQATAGPTSPANQPGGRPTISLVTDLSAKPFMSPAPPPQPAGPAARTNTSTSVPSPASGRTTARNSKMQMTFDDILGPGNSRLQHSPSSPSLQSVPSPSPSPSPPASHKADRSSRPKSTISSPAKPDPVTVSPDEKLDTPEEERPQPQVSPVIDSLPPSPAKSDAPAVQPAPAISIARASEDGTNRALIVRNVERQLPDFRTVMAIKSHKDKLAFLNRARDEAYNTETGFDRWAIYMLETCAEHADVFEKEHDMGAAQSESSAALSPLHAKHTSTARTLSRLTSLASSMNGHSSRPSFLTSTQVQTKGKDFLQSAGGAAKGLFAKGRSRWRGGGATE